MKFQNKVIEYLDGRNFSSGLKVKLSGSKHNFTRIDLINKLVTKKKVIHLGCADHLPLIEKKMNNNTWLHKIITENANKCIGIDINEEAINFIKEKYGYNNIYSGDIFNIQLNDIDKDEWDYIVMGEILEHVNNPVQFLTDLNNMYYSNVKEVIVTVPNAFSFDNFIDTFKNIEYINSDHRYWFTPYTLAKVATEAGLTVNNIFLCNGYVSYRHFVKKAVINNHHFLRDTIVLTASFKNHGN